MTVNGNGYATVVGTARLAIMLMITNPRSHRCSAISKALPGAPCHLTNQEPDTRKWNQVLSPEKEIKVKGN